jgi:hypothetical protein
MNLVSAPSSEILLEKNVGRIGGYDYRSEVYNPVVYFRTPETTSEYRVTALLSRYATEQAKTAAEIPVTGTGHALQVHSSTYDDYIYTGKGTSTFAGFTTDADTVFIRTRGNTEEITLIGGSYLGYQNDRLISLSEKTEILTARKDGSSIEYRISNKEEVPGSFFGNGTFIKEGSDAGIIPPVYQTPVVNLAENVPGFYPSRGGESYWDWYSALLQVKDAIRKVFFH